MSTSTNDPLPAIQIPVGEILGRELKARDWTQADFANILGRPTQFVSEIVGGKKEITRESAAQIGAALGTSPEFWLNLQDQYHLAEQAKDKSTQARLNEVRRRAHLKERGPITLLQKRGYLRGKTLDELEAEVLEFFEIKSLDQEPSFAAAAKRSNHDEPITTLQTAWVACIRHEARAIPVREPYCSERLVSLAASLARTLTTPDSFARLPDLLAEAGVRLVHVEALPGAKIDGCAMFVDGTPVIGLSGRGKRLDKVLFALLHELAHIALGHVDATRLIVESLDDEDHVQTDNETDANATAAKWIFPSGLPRPPARIGADWVDTTARQLGIAPIVLVGQLQYKGRLDWRTSLVRNAPSVGDVLASWK